jgi:gliding motility-associated-like protein
MKHLQRVFAFFCFLSVCGFSTLYGQENQISLVKTGVRFEQNLQQWPAQVLFSTDVTGGRIFFEQQQFTVSLYSLSDLEESHHDAHEKGSDRNKAMIAGHAYRQKFIGARTDASLQGKDKRSEIVNYFKGNDPAKWSSNVPVFNGVQYTGLYSGINLDVYSSGGKLKYDYIVQAGADASQILVQYEGIDQLQLRENALILTTSIGEVIEEKPFAYQIIAGKKTEVACVYVLKNGKVSFEFPNGYDNTQPLVIDPILVSATYSGSVSTNYGHCATYDAAGNIYTGAISFGPGYPITVGAFQAVFGGQIDIAISKLDPQGSNLIFATYIGGTDGDYPHSMFVDGNNELFIYGSTRSSNFPTTVGAYDQTFNGAGFDVDIVVSKLNTTGTMMLGSTFVGGSGMDGSNAVWGNYGDTYRGEIICDGAGNPYIASFSASANFPTTPGAYDQTQNGMQDAVFFKMNTTLTALTWSTFMGGSLDDAGYSLRLASTGDLYVCGTTMSNNLPTIGGTLFPSYQGGTKDGFVALLTNNGGSLATSTYFGTSGDDNTYFMDLDNNGDVYIYGSSTNSIPTTVGVYSNPGSPHYITKIDPALTSVIYSTVFGDGSLMSTISPTAFMVDVCQNVYAAGWGQTTGYPVSGNAIQPTTDGSDFYLLVLQKDAIAMTYATYFGANGGWEHVDGGTSRFDPNGIVYEAICQGAMNMTTTATAYSPTNLAGSYDVAVFKIDFQAVGVNATANASADTVCVNQLVTYTNGSINAVQYLWDFGDGSPLDTNMIPSHIYTTPGTYTVILVAIDSASCNIADTVTFPITVLAQPAINLGNDTTICGPFNLTLTATNVGCTYTWSTGANTPTINVNAAGIYWVIADNGYCQATDTIDISVFSLPNIGSDTSLCLGQQLVLDAGNPGSNYTWNTGATTQTIQVNTTGIYWVDVSSGNCSFRDSITVNFLPVPVVNLGNDTAICPGGQFSLDAGNPGSSYVWSNGDVTQVSQIDTAGMVSVTVSLGNCVSSDSMNVEFLPSVDLGRDVSLCDLTNGAVLDAGFPGSQYLWSTGATTQQITVFESGTYYVDIVNASQCALSDTIELTGDAGGGIIYVPNSFTPNNDGKNECFHPVASGVTEFQMMIFNRWGQLIFVSNDYYDCWDGTYKGTLVQEDVYVVKMQYKTLCSDKLLQKITHVAVIR